MQTDEPRGWHSRGYLPHFDGGEVSQMLTFRLADSLPAGLLESWRDELECATRAQRGTELRRRIEPYLDEGTGEGLLGDPRVARTVEDAFLYFDGERYRLHAWVVMPNHVHVLVTPLPEHSLSRIIHSWKSYTAKAANRVLGRSGAFWARDYFDRYARDGQHFAAAVAYIEHNPVKAGLCAQREDWPFSSARLR